MTKPPPAPPRLSLTAEIADVAGHPMTGAGQTIGRYEIEAEIGRGSMGIVYRAYDPLLQRTIALKTILAPHGMTETALKAFEERFFEEARAAARLSHHAIVIVHDLGRDEASGILFLALEYLHGQTLSQLIAGDRALDWREALRIAEPLAEGIQHASLLGSSTRTSSLRTS